MAAVDEAAVQEFALQHATATVVYVCVDDTVAAVLALADEVWPEAAAAVKALRRLGMSVKMLTGDATETTIRVGAAVGIAPQDCHARMLPADKLQWIQRMQAPATASPSLMVRACAWLTCTQRVCMVGDGINDAAALAGVAMGQGGSAMAAEAANIVIMSDNLSRLPETLATCRLGRRLILQNCALTVAVKLVAVVLAITGALSFICLLFILNAAVGSLQFWQAVLVDVGTLLVVVLNGTRPLALARGADGKPTEEAVEGRSTGASGV